MLPIIAVVSPGFAEKLISVRVSSSLSAYLKDTFSNLTISTINEFYTLLQKPDMAKIYEF